MRTITPASYNAAWWELRRHCQGVVPPVARTQADCDPGAKYRNTPHPSYFPSLILPLGSHKTLCVGAGQTGRLRERLNAAAIIEYFRPLMGWLSDENQNRQCGRE